MMWIDYNIQSYPDGSFSVVGDWPGEVMGVTKDGKAKDTKLYLIILHKMLMYSNFGLG